MCDPLQKIERVVVAREGIIRLRISFSGGRSWSFCADDLGWCGVGRPAVSCPVAEEEGAAALAVESAAGGACVADAALRIGVDACGARPASVEGRLD